jgi:hypothetical protein
LPVVAGGLRSLAPVVDVEGPRVRLGLAWAALTSGALAVSVAALAVWLGLVAGAAIWQASSTWRRQPARPLRPLAAAGATLPILVLAGPVALAAAVVAIMVAAAALLRGDRARVVSTVACAWLIGAAAAAPVVVAREWGTTEAAVLLWSTFVYDGSAYIVGSGTVHRWEGVAAGIASMAPLTLAAAAVLVPPFRGASAFILGAVAAVALPIGPLAATALLGRRNALVPALRRVDSLLLAGPAWVATAALVL